MQEYCDTATAHFFEQVKLLRQPRRRRRRRRRRRKRS